MQRVFTRACELELHRCQYEQALACVLRCPVRDTQNLLLQRVVQYLCRHQMFDVLCRLSWGMFMPLVTQELVRQCAVDDSAGLYHRAAFAFFMSQSRYRDGASVRVRARARVHSRACFVRSGACDVRAPGGARRRAGGAAGR